MIERKDKGGRPTKKDEECIKKLEEIFKLDGTASEACSYAGISEVTYYDRIKKDEVFSKQMAKAKDYAFIAARRTLMKGVYEGDTKCAVEMLKRRDKRYSEKTDVSNTHTIISEDELSD